MTIPRDAICDELEVDACLARLQLIAARRRLRLADTAANRTAAAGCQARLDVILDLLVELGSAGPMQPPADEVRHPREEVPPRRVPGPRPGR